jgi:hypothetical protein
MLKSKGIDKLISAFSEAMNLNCELYLIGDFDFKNKDSVPEELLRSYIERSDGKIIHVGYTSDVSRYLEDIDVLVSFSKREGLPFSIMDGIDAGCILFLSDVPGHRSFSILEGVYYGTPADFVLFVKKISDNPDSYFSFDELKREQIALQNWGDEAVRNHIFKLYKAMNQI